MRAAPILAATSLALLTLASSAIPASFEGKVIDGPWYNGSIVNHLAGKFDDCRIQFQSEKLYVKLPGGATIVGFMDEEIVIDPHEIHVYDPKRSLYWIVDVVDLNR